MQEIEFTKEDEYCIRNFGYNEVKDYEEEKKIKKLIITNLNNIVIIKKTNEIIDKINEIIDYLEENK